MYSHQTARRGIALRLLIGIGLLTCLAGVTLVVSACGSSSSGTGDGSGGEGGASAEAVTIATDADPAAFGYDPAAYSGGGVTTFWQALYSSLFVTDSSGAVKPGLAQSYSFNSDKTQLTLELRGGVKFTDGSTLSAQLVKENLDRRSDPKLGAYGVFAKGGAAEITKVTAPDQSTVVISFAKPQASAPSLLANDAGRIVGAKAVADPKILMGGPDGSGPYTLEAGKTVQSSTYALKKNPSSWDASSYPFSTVTFKVIAEPAARTNALASGQAEVAQVDPSSTQIGSGNKLAKFPGTIYGFAVFDKEGKISPPFGQVKVRQALTTAINRDQLAELHEGATPTASFFPPGTQGFSEALDQRYEYDPAKAKQLLAEAGYANGFSFKTVTIGLTHSVDLEAVQNDWKAIGVNMEIEQASSFAAGLQSQSTTPLGYNNLTVGRNPLGFVQSFLLSGTLNSQHATNAAIESALEEAESGGGNSDEAALTELNEAIVDEGWFLPAYAQDGLVGFNPAEVTEPESPGDSLYPTLSSIRPAE